MCHTALYSRLADEGKRGGVRVRLGPVSLMNKICHFKGGLDYFFIQFVCIFVKEVELIVL